MLSGILTEYISNVGRTIKFLSDKYAGTMTPEVSCKFQPLINLGCSVANRKLYYIHYLRVELLKYRIWRDISVMT